mmetsp:Transcript_34155/g.61864  ORF Transcript_34155/g.61864 Transcript_34155/m.61864 type:complete len:287 (-) Transcript_34155:937-1797(-)
MLAKAARRFSALDSVPVAKAFWVSRPLCSRWMLELHSDSRILVASSRAFAACAAEVCALSCSSRAARLPSRVVTLLRKTSTPARLVFSPSSPDCMRTVPTWRSPSLVSMDSMRLLCASASSLRMASATRFCSSKAEKLASSPTCRESTCNFIDSRLDFISREDLSCTVMRAPISWTKRSCRERSTSAASEAVFDSNFMLSVSRCSCCRMVAHWSIASCAARALLRVTRASASSKRCITRAWRPSKLAELRSRSSSSCVCSRACTEELWASRRWHRASVLDSFCASF